MCDDSVATVVLGVVTPNLLISVGWRSKDRAGFLTDIDGGELAGAFWEDVTGDEGAEAAIRVDDDPLTALTASVAVPSMDFEATWDGAFGVADEPGFLLTVVVADDDDDDAVFVLTVLVLTAAVAVLGVGCVVVVEEEDGGAGKEELEGILEWPLGSEAV